MPADISGRKLLVISDTPMCKEAEGYVAFEPVVRELEAVVPLFNEIIWLGCSVREKKYAMRAPEAHLPIRIIPMPGVLNKYNIVRMLWVYPVFAYYVLKFARATAYIHTRGPSHPALLGIFLSMVSRKRSYWHKYAGNWVGGKLALTYKLQKRLLKLAGSDRVKVTVNGKWSDNPDHILTFENPCFSNAELVYATAKAGGKDFTGKLNLLFVGNLTAAKGILKLVDAMKAEGRSDRFATLYVAGDGELQELIARKIADSNSDLNIHLLGYQSRNELDRLYAECHVLVLPSASEGFPKVVAEAAAFGCIPVVTDVSAISQYIHHGKNGFLLRDNGIEEIVAGLNNLASAPSLKSVSVRAQDMAAAFTYERFVNRLKNEIFNLE